MYDCVVKDASRVIFLSIISCITLSQRYSINICLPLSIYTQWWRDLFRCRIDLLNFSIGFNIIAPYIWSFYTWIYILLKEIYLSCVCKQQKIVVEMSKVTIFSWEYSDIYVKVTLIYKASRVLGTCHPMLPDSLT